MTTSLQVLLSHFQPGEVAMRPKTFEWVAVASIKEAAAKVRAYAQEHELGSRDWFGGIVRDDKKKPVGCIALNGNELSLEECSAFLNNAKALLKK